MAEMPFFELGNSELEGSKCRRLALGAATKFEIFDIEIPPRAKTFCHI